MKEERQRINILLEKHQPREEIQEKEMVVLSEKGKEISIKTEVASSSMKPFEERPVEHEEEASKRKYEVIGTDIEMEYEEMDTEDEEHEVRRLTKEELEIYHQYKEFYTIQAFSHPIEGEVQDNRFKCQNKKLLKLNKSMLWYQEAKLTLDQRRRQSYYALIQTPTQM